MPRNESRVSVQHNNNSTYSKYLCYYGLAFAGKLVVTSVSVNRALDMDVRSRYRFTNL